MLYHDTGIVKNVHNSHFVIVPLPLIKLYHLKERMGSDFLFYTGKAQSKMTAPSLKINFFIAMNQHENRNLIFKRIGD